MEGPEAHVLGCTGARGVGAGVGVGKQPGSRAAVPALLEGRRGCGLLLFV